MNMTELLHYQSFDPFEQACQDSIRSTSSTESCQSIDSPPHESIQIQLDEHIQSLPLIIQQMISEQPQGNSQISPYLSKRKAIMNWLQKYSQQLNISRNAASAVQYYTDYYYHNYEYSQKNAKMRLTSLIILASKHCDHRILYTNHLAYVCDLDSNQLNKTELDSCQKIDFNFSIDTYSMIADTVIGDIKTQCGIDLYEENQQSYTKLRMIHRVVQRLYTDNYQWNANFKDVCTVIRCALETQIKTNDRLVDFFQSRFQDQIQNLMEPENQEEESFVEFPQAQQYINKYIKQWKQIKQEKVRSAFRNRRRQQKYINFSNFCLKYHQ